MVGRAGKGCTERRNEGMEDRSIAGSTNGQGNDVPSVERIRTTSASAFVPFNYCHARYLYFHGTFLLCLCV